MGLCYQIGRVKWGLCLGLFVMFWVYKLFSWNFELLKFLLVSVLFVLQQTILYFHCTWMNRIRPVSHFFYYSFVRISGFFVFSWLRNCHFLSCLVTRFVSKIESVMAFVKNVIQEMRTALEFLFSRFEDSELYNSELSLPIWQFWKQKRLLSQVGIYIRNLSSFLIMEHDTECLSLSFIITIFFKKKM